MLNNKFRDLLSLNSTYAIVAKRNLVKLTREQTRK